MKVTPFALCLALAGFASPNLFSAETNRPNFDLVRQLNDAFVQVAENVSPAVVVLTISESGTVFAEPDAALDPRQHEYWRKFHEQFDSDTQGSGSGIIVRKDGYILTNRHVVEDAEKIEVRLLDGRTFIAKVRGVDPQSDVAVIKIEADNLPTAKLGDSSKVRVGEFAIAIGAPFNLDYTVTYGHISAKSRSNVVPFDTDGRMMDQDFFQTDANINPGNSGGPLVNIEGEVIGVNTLIRGLRTGIGFAIPINLAKEVGEKLIADGKFVRPWLGIEIRALTDPEIRDQNKGIAHGVVVQKIFTNGPAANSELRAGDVVTAVDGISIGSVQQLRSEVRSKTIGKAVTLDVFRAGATMKIAVKPGESMPSAPRPVYTNSPKPNP